MEPPEPAPAAQSATDAAATELRDPGLLFALNLDVLNDLESIDLVNEAFNALAVAHDVPDAARRAFNIAFDELINNIVSYGFEDTAEHRILVEVHLTAGVLEAALSDDGTPFDPFAMETPDLEAELDERRIGGLGVHLVRSMMDEVRYERTNDRNVVVIRKFLRQDAGESSGP